MMVLVLEDDFEFILATFHWWQPSTTSLIIAPIRKFQNFHAWDCSCEHSPGCTCTYVHTWDCSCEHSPGCTRIFGCGGCPSMQQSGLHLPFVFMCLLYDFLSFLFHSRLCIWNQHCLGWKIFFSHFSVSRGMSLWETDLQSLLNQFKNVNLVK